ncbi:tyrosine-protein phosphatase [Streptomyces sp. NPDC002668]|uniref:tyrosine-protein phosphatase n=1 Tax=Streptomyces sp. NPDC002668 TaxID=3154422 RepID=UPI00332F76EB
MRGRRRRCAACPAADSQWFRLVPDQGAPLALADRSVHLEGAPNFRDTGGYRTELGRIGIHAAADLGAHPLVHHSTAGKDRTGWAGAALLATLGGEHDTVMRDYLATNGFRARRTRRSSTS